MLKNNEFVEEFKKSLSATVKSIGKNEELEINYVKENPSIIGNTINLTDTSSRDIAQYYQDGFWTSNKYLPGMYLRIENHPDKPGVKRAYFRGIIATSKLFLSDKKIKDREGDSQKRKNRFVTFITLGISDDKWIDIVAWGPRKLAKVHCLEGFGFWEDDSWIRVESMNIDRLTSN